MTDKQKKFCLHYVQSGNATAAATAAGFSAHTAYSQGQRLLKNVEIQKFLKELTAPTTEKEIVNANAVLAFFSHVMQDEEQQTRDRLRAAENLAKRMGIDKPETEQAEETNAQPVFTFVFSDTSMKNKEQQAVFGAPITCKQENNRER